MDIILKEIFSLKPTTHNISIAVKNEVTFNQRLEEAISPNDEALQRKL